MFDFSIIFELLIIQLIVTPHISLGFSCNGSVSMNLPIEYQQPASPDFENVAKFTKTQVLEFQW